MYIECCFGLWQSLIQQIVELFKVFRVMAGSAETGWKKLKMDCHSKCMQVLG